MKENTFAKQKNIFYIILDVGNWELNICGRNILNFYTSFTIMIILLYHITVTTSEI